MLRDEEVKRLFSLLLKLYHERGYMKLRVLIGYILCMMLSASELLSQVNVRVGYVAAFPQLSVNDNLLSSFDPVNGEVSDGFGSTGFMQGLQLGLRYRIGNFAIETGWESVSRDRSALIFNSLTESFTNRAYNYSLSSFRTGIDNYFGKYGIGTTLMYQRLKIDRIIGGNDLTLTKERQLGLRLEFIWQVQESSAISFEIRPFYQFSLKDYNLSGLAEDLDLSTGVDIMESPKIWGVSLVFYNGRQR